MLLRAAARIASPSHHTVVELLSFIKGDRHLQKQANLLGGQAAAAEGSSADRLAVPVRKLRQHDGHVVRSADGDDVDRRWRCGRAAGTCTTC